MASSPMAPPTPSLISLFDSICASDGDATAFVACANNNDYYDVESSSSKPGHFTEVGFSEMREAVIAIASELCHRHGVRSTVSASTLPSPRGVLVISDHPSAGEAAAVLACTRVRVPFVPVDLVGPNRVGMKRLRSLLSDCECRAAIVVVDANDADKLHGEKEPDAETEGDQDEVDDDFLTMPAVQTTADPQLDQHPAVRLLERAGVYRHVMISSRDGTVLNGLGISELELPEPIIEETGVSLRDPLYVLCTSGSTSSGQGQQKSGKAVLQTHEALLNRIRWQWETFPFVQQMRRDIGFAETNRLLEADGLPPTARNDMVVRRTPLSFVDSICEIFATLLAGVPLYCPSPQLLRREGLAGILGEADNVGATRITCLPSQMSQMLRIGSKSTSWPWRSLNVAIVSGEPCPPSLPKLWETCLSALSSQCAHKLLINLYGQTESSADVLCTVVSKGGTGISPEISRFPKASNYLFLSDRGSALRGGEWWSATKTNTELQVPVDDFLARSLRWTVPCGLPILRHNVMIGSPQLCGEADADLKSTICMGRLFVKGPGLALGYLNRQQENENSFKEVNGERWFDTGDLACLDDDTGVVYILGRAGGEEGGQIGNKGSSLVGKINGVLVHTAEVEAVFAAALSEIIQRKDKSALKKKETPSNSGLDAVAVFFQVKSKEPDDSSAIPNNPTRLSVFIGLSCIPESLRDHSNQISCSTCTLIPPNEALVSSHDGLLEEAKALLVGSDRSRGLGIGEEFVCHPALIPHRIHLVSRMPQSGAAGKIDRSELVRLSSTCCSKDDGECTEGLIGENCPIHSLLMESYVEVLGLDSLKSMALSFLELGGDSMMAIECAHKINLQLKTTKGAKVARVSAMDVIKLSMEEVECLISSGMKPREAGVAKEMEGKSVDFEYRSEHLESLGGVIPSSSGCSGNEAIHVAWKCPLLMCVDAKPLLVDHATFGNVVVTGSQGGDILCCRAESGEVLHRKQLKGKIEGGMAAFQIKTDKGENNHARTFFFVCTYSEDGGTGGSGKVYALELCKKRKLGDDQGQISVVWARGISGKLKGSPAFFSIAEEHDDPQANLTRFGVLVGCYDGALRYFDAISGESVACLDDLGGAIHATPTIFDRNEGISKCALVASSTWSGRLSCIHLQRKSMTKLWCVDIWSPIYASPLVCVKEKGESCVAVFGAVDGAVRCLDLESGAGSELWKTSIGSGKPIFSGCAMVPKGNNGDDNSVVVGSHDGSVSRISINDGSCVWRYQGVGSVIGTPALVDESSVVRSIGNTSKVIAVGSTSGNIVCLDAESGEVKKQLPEPIDGEIFSDVATSNSSARMLFFGARDSHLYSCTT